MANNISLLDPRALYQSNVLNKGWNFEDAVHMAIDGRCFKFKNDIDMPTSNIGGCLTLFAMQDIARQEKANHV